MLRYMLLAGAAALALPGAAMAQVQWSEPLPGENNASSVMDNPGVLDSPTDYDLPFNQAPTGFNAGDYATAQQDRTRTPIGDAYVPDASDDTTTAQSPQAGNGVYGSQPSGGYYFGDQGDQPLATPVSQQGAAGPPEGANSGPSSPGYGGGGYYTGDQGAPSAYEGQGGGSYESPISGQGLGGEGAYQQGQTQYGYGQPPQGANSAPPPSQGGGQGYTGGGYYTGDQGAGPNQPAGPPPGAYGAPPPDQGFSGGGYDTGPQGAGPNQPYAGQPQGAYRAPPPSQGAYSNPPGYAGGGYYSSEQGANATEVNVPGNTGQPILIVPASGLSSGKYIRETSASNLYQIRAARIALRRSHSPQVRDYARQMIQDHRQGLVTITQASVQAGMPQLPRLSLAHRLMLARLRRTPARDFDAVYMNQQVVAHMNQVSVQKGYALNGDNSALQQVASNSSPAVEQHLAVAWNLTGQPERLAARRDAEMAMLDQNAGRGQTYRGYTVIGPTSTSELASRRAQHYRGYGYRGYSTGGVPGRRHHHKGGFYDQYNLSLKGGATGVSYRQSGGTGGGYQGYTSSQGAQQPGTAGTTGVPGSPGYGTAPPGGGATPGAPGTSSYGAPQYQGYSNPNANPNPGGTTSPPPATGAPSYQGYGGLPGYSSPQSSPGYTTPSTPGPTGAPPYQGSPGSPGYANPGTPGYANPGSPNPNSPNPNGI